MAGVAPSPTPPPSSSSLSKFAQQGFTSPNTNYFINSTSSSTTTSTNAFYPNQYPMSNKKLLSQQVSLRLKTNDFFYKWFTKPERSEQLREAINFIKSTNKIPKFNDVFNASQNGTKVHDFLPFNNSNISNINQSNPFNNTTASSNINLINQHLRPKSPISMQSPPMSPISRMPLSPKSPRQRYSSALVSNSNSSKSLNNQFNNSKEAQSPITSPRDDRNTSKVSIQFNQNQNQNNNNNNLQKNLKSPRNEKEIQIQRVSSNDLLSNKAKNDNLVNFIDLQVVNNNQNANNINNSILNNQILPSNANLQLNQHVKQSISTSPLPAANVDLGKQQFATNQLNKHKLKPQQKVNVPQFYYPHGKPDERQFKGIDDVENMKAVSAEFRMSKDGKVFKEQFGEIVKMLGLPRYWKSLLFKACTFNTKTNYVTYSSLEQVWTKLTTSCFERASLFMKLISNTNYIVYEDWDPLLQDIVDSHPGLKFLQIGRAHV